MYEDVSYEGILNRMLNRVPDSLDKREGGVIYTALAPAAAEMKIMYIELDQVLKETFAVTASREYLIKRAAERGITPNPATAAVVKAVAVPDTVEIEIGERFNLGYLNYVVTEKTGAGVYQMECETAGIIGGSKLGAMIPIGNISGLETITLSEVLVPGRDDESAASILERYRASFDEQAFGGNRQDYLDKTHAIAGVGGVKVTRAWNGPGTVKLTVLDAGYNKASDLLVSTVQEIIDPTQDGEGTGLAPIDHIVTVDTAEEVSVAIQTTLAFSGGYTYASVENQIADAIQGYLLELRKEWESETALVVRISQIDARILGIQGIVDVDATMINGAAENLELTEFQIPIFGGVSIG